MLARPGFESARDSRPPCLRRVERTALQRWQRHKHQPEVFQRYRGGRRCWRCLASWPQCTGAQAKLGVAVRRRGKAEEEADLLNTAARSRAVGLLGASYTAPGLLLVQDAETSGRRRGRAVAKAKRSLQVIGVTSHTELPWSFPHAAHTHTCRAAAVTGSLCQAASCRPAGGQQLPETAPSTRNAIHLDSCHSKNHACGGHRAPVPPFLGHRAARVKAQETARWAKCENCEPDRPVLREKCSTPQSRKS